MQTRAPCACYGTWRASPKALSESALRGSIGDRAGLRILGTVGPLFVCKLKSVQVASSIDDITAVILGARFHRGRRARLIAVSGIDGSGKGYVSARLAEKLAGKGFRVAVIAADGWLNLPHVRFGGG